MKFNANAITEYFGIFGGVNNNNLNKVLSLSSYYDL